MNSGNIFRHRQAPPDKSDSYVDFSESFSKGTNTLSIFRRIQEAMNFIPDFAETAKAILDVVIDEIKPENCSIMLKDSKSGELAVRVARGVEDEKSVYYPEHFEKESGKRFKMGEGLAGWVWKEGLTVKHSDVTKETRFVKREGSNKIRSLVCVPIAEKNQIVGVLNLSHSKRWAFEEMDSLTLKYIAGQLGIALMASRISKKIPDILPGPENMPNDYLKHMSSAEKVKHAIVSSRSGIFNSGEVAGSYDKPLIHSSRKMQKINEIINQVAEANVTVLIQGESGVGKEVVARSIHSKSPRHSKPFVKVNCAALPQELLESELFGYERGAFTGAYSQKPGKFELANEGTIFLDEIGEISLALQSKLLQVLQDKEFSRLGGKRDISVDVRVLVATNKDLKEAVKNRQFREDLYYRLNVVNIGIPALRERKEELPLLVDYFLDKFGKKFNKKIKQLSDKMMKVLLHYNWPGNVRELENIIQRLFVLDNEEAILDELTLQDLPESYQEEEEQKDPKQSGNLFPSLKDVQKEATARAEVEVIRKALELTNWNRKKAALMLDISYKTLLYKIKEWKIDKKSE